MTDALSEALEHRREAIVNQVLDRIYGLLEELWSGDCRYHARLYPYSLQRDNCYAIALGVLMRRMRSFGLEIPRPVNRPIKERSFLQLYDFSTHLESNPNAYLENSKECTLQGKTEHWEMEISQIDICDGVRLADFKVAESTQEDNEPSQKRKREASVIITNTRVCVQAQGEL